MVCAALVISFPDVLYRKLKPPSLVLMLELPATPVALEWLHLTIKSRPSYVLKGHCSGC